MSLWASNKRHRGIARRGVEHWIEQLNRRGAVRHEEINARGHIPDIERRDVVLHEFCHIGNQWSRLCYTVLQFAVQLCFAAQRFPKRRDPRERRNEKLTLRPRAVAFHRGSRSANQGQRGRLNSREMKFPLLLQTLRVVATVLVPYHYEIRGIISTRVHPKCNPEFRMFVSRIESQRIVAILRYRKMIVRRKCSTIC